MEVDKQSAAQTEVIMPQATEKLEAHKGQAEREVKRLQENLELVREQLSQEQHEMPEEQQRMRAETEPIISGKQPEIESLRLQGQSEMQITNLQIPNLKDQLRTSQQEVMRLQHTASCISEKVKQVQDLNGRIAYLAEANVG